MIRLKRLYVNTASSFCIIIGFIGSSEFRRNLYGCFGGCLRQEIFGGNLVKDIASQEIF